MSFINHSKYKYLLLLPLLFLVLNALFFQYATKEIQRAMLNQKLTEVKNATDTLAAAIDADPTWAQDDYEINIAGVFMGENGELPENDLRKFRRYCEARKLIEVQSDLFTLFNISQLAIESFELPFTKGVENQMYTIKAYSDDNFDLLVKEEKR